MSIVTRKLYHLSGLSTDTKPIPEDIATGSTFYETDTGVNFVFNKSTNQWIPSKEKVEPQVETPCLGILSIELTSRAGLVDTYTIRYTNGASTTFNVTNGGYVTPNIDIKTPLIDNKIYTLDINTEKYNLYATADFRVTEVTDNTIKSEVIDHTKFWPRTDEGKFLLKIAADTTLIFNYVGVVNDLETWQAVEINNDNLFIRYVGHFEYVDDHNRENSDFYFVAEKQTISFIDLKESVDSLDERATSLENRANALEAGLAAEEQRATSKESELEDLINEHIHDYDDLIERVSVEETRAIATDTELETRIAKEVEARETADAALDELKADRVNYDQTIVANELEAREAQFFAGVYSTDADKIALIKATHENGVKKLSISEDGENPIEEVNVKATNVNLNLDINTTNATTLETVAGTITTTVNTETKDANRIDIEVGVSTKDIKTAEIITNAGDKSEAVDGETVYRFEKQEPTQEAEEAVDVYTANIAVSNGEAIVTVNGDTAFSTDALEVGANEVRITSPVISTEGNITSEGNIANTGNIANQGNLTNDGNVEINNGTLDVEGKTTLENDLEVQQNTDLQGTLAVTGATELNDTLDVAEKATFDKAVEIKGTTTSNSITNTGAIDNIGNITNSGTLENTGKATLKDDLNVKKNTVLEGTLEVQGRSTTTGITNNGTIINNGTVTNTGDLTQHGPVTIDGGGNTATTVKINGDLENKGKVSILDGGRPDGGNLDVARNVTVGQDLTVVGAADFKSTTTFEDDITVTANIDVTGNITDTGTITHTGELKQYGAVKINGGESGGETASTTITTKATIANTGNITNSGTFENTGKATLKNDLNVKQNTLLEGTLETAGNTDLNGTLDVAGKTTLENNLEVQGNTELQGTLEVDGNTALTDTTVAGQLQIKNGNEVVATVNDPTNHQVTINKAITVNAALNLNDNTTVAANKTLRVNGDTQLATLTASGDVVLGGVNKTVNIAAATTNTGTFTVNGTTVLNGNILVPDSLLDIFNVQ